MAKLHSSLKNKPHKRTNFLRDREFWYKDIILVPNRLPNFERDEVNLTTHFTKNIILKTPFVSSPMDTVTEADMAILIALMGGIGVIHYNFLTIREQMVQVEKVKRFEAGFIKNPVCLSPDHLVKDVFEIHDKYGFFSAPITKDGTSKTKLIGIVTHRDVRYLDLKSLSLPLKKIMTPAEKLITAHRKNTFDKNNIETANKIIRKNNLDTLPIVDDKFKLIALVTDSDLKKNALFPLATKNENKQLRVFIAVEARIKLAQERITGAVEFGVDGIVIDAGVVFEEQLEIAKWVKKNFPKLEIVLGNVASASMVEKILQTGAKYCDGLRVGIGPGLACITQQELGAGRAQGSAVWDCSQAVKKLKRKYGFIPIIADGGIKVLDYIGQDVAKPGDIAKALALGAQTVMMGGLLAGLEEAPSEKEFDWQENKMIKKYRGMGSIEAMEKRGSLRYGIEKMKIKFPEGKVIKVPYRGSGYDFIPQLIAGLKQSLQKQGFKNIKELQKEADIRTI